MAEVLAQPGTSTPSGRRTVDWSNGALLEVWIANRPMLVELAVGIVGCAGLAEDVVHDVFMKLLDFPAQDAVRQPVAYVTRIVRNASMDALHRQRDESAAHTGHADHTSGGAPHAAVGVAAPENSPEAALLARDTLRHVYRALEQLPPRNRAAFEMVRLREETLQSTARALAVSQTLVHCMVRDAEQHCVAACLAADSGNFGANGR